MPPDASGRLAVIETHPIQYHAPVYRALQAGFGVPVTAIYGSDFSVAGYRDQEFGATFAWDTDLLTGYDSVFLSRVNAAWPVAGLSQALRRVQPRAVLLTGYRPGFDQRAIIQTAAMRLPILFRGETTDHARRRSPLKSITRDLALRCFYARCTSLLYVGKRSYAHFRRLGCPDERLVFSPYCVDDSVFAGDEQTRAAVRSATRASLGIVEHQFAFLFSGKLSLRKGPDLLLLALRQLPAHLRDRCVAVFLGSGEAQPMLSRLASTSPELQTRFVGFKNQRQLSPIYHAADLLVLPSRTSETWGLVVNEALHHGSACVVSAAVGCGADLVEPGRTGDIFETGSVESLALALERSLRLVGKLDVRDRCRKKVAAYSVEAAARGIAQGFAAVLESTSPPRRRPQVFG